MNENLQKIIAYENAFSKALLEAREGTVDSEIKTSLTNVFKRFGELQNNKISVDITSLPSEISESIKNAIGDKQTITTDIFESLEKTHIEEDTGVSKAISEMLSGKLYSTPKKLSKCVKETSEHFGVDEDQIIETFTSYNKFTPQEFADAIIDEGLGDYLQYKGQQIANNIVGKYGIGQSKVIANAKNKTLGDANTVLSKWNEITQGNQAAATGPALQAFLTGQFKMDPKVAAQTVKKYKPKFLITPQSLKKVAQNAAGQQPTAASTPKSSVGAFLPPNALRSFFGDAITAQRQLVLKPNKPVSSTTPSKPKATTTIPTQPVQATQPVQPKTANTGVAQPAQATQPAAQTTGKATADQFSQMINSLPANQRAQAILQALPALSDSDIKAVLNGLVSKKP
jgi:hypothetical protein